MLKEVARQVKAATDPLTTQFERLCDLRAELPRDTSKRSQENLCPHSRYLGPRSERYDMVTGAPLTARSELLNGPLNPMMRQPDNITSTGQQ